MYLSVLEGDSEWSLIKDKGWDGILLSRYGTIYHLRFGIRAYIVFFLVLKAA